MTTFIAWLKDWATRLQTKCPKFFLILMYIAGGISAILGLAIWLNSEYAFNWESIMIYGNMDLIDLFYDIIKILGGVFLASAVTTSTKSKKRSKLKLQD